MEKTNHWSEANTTALIQGLGGLAGNIIDKKQSGGNVSNAENQIAGLSQQLLQTLGLANQQQQQVQQPVKSGITGNTVILLIVGVLVVGILAFAIFKRK